MIFFHRRQTAALDECFFVPWEYYDWHDLLQCNYNNDGGGIKIHWNPAVYCIIAACHGVALYMAFDLIIKTLLRFTQWNSLYFWALIVSSLGIVLETLSNILVIWVLPPDTASAAVLSILGSVPLITGFGFVLYSRLHLVFSPTTISQRKLQWVLASVIFASVCFTVPGVVATLIGSSGAKTIMRRMYTHIRFFEISYAVQDVFLESLYIYHFRRYMDDVPAHAKQDLRRQMRKMFYLMCATSVVVTICDLVGVILLCMSILLVRYTILGLLYGVKLHTEFFVLNRLVKMTELKHQILRQGNLSEIFIEGAAGTHAASHIGHNMIVTGG